MLLLALAGALVVETPMVPAFFNADTIRAICKEKSDAKCLMYVAGVLDGVFYVRFNDGVVRLCPSLMNNREAANLVVEYLDDNPGERSRAAAAVIRKAVAGHIECESAAKTASN